jgi:spore coat protein U-like protein
LTAGIWLLAGAAMLVGGPARALCSIELSPVAFGVIDTTARSTGTGEVVVRCDTATGFAVAISGGGGRRMNGPGGSRLDYRLYADAARAIPWGDGGSAGNAVAAASDGAGARRLTIYGEVPAQSGVLPGEYLDGLEVTLTF